MLMLNAEKAGPTLRKSVVGHLAGWGNVQGRLVDMDR